MHSFTAIDADYPNAADLDGDHVAQGSLGPMLRYVHSKQVLACAMTHLASKGVGGHHVLFGPGTVDTGIHAKESAEQMTAMMKATLWMNRITFMLPGTGTPETASQPIVAAAMGEFDRAEPGVCVVDRGEELDLVLCDNPEQNASIYESLLERAHAA